MKIKRIYYLFFLLIFIQHITITAMYNNNTTNMVYPYTAEQTALAMQVYNVNYKNTFLSQSPSYTINACNKSITNNAMLPKKNPITCPTCNKIFNYECDYKIHLIKHSNERPYACTICGSTFKYKTNCTKHMKQQFCLSNIKQHICSYCKKPITKNSYVCQICTKSFHCRISFWRHTKIHTGEKPYLCPICNKRFTDCSNCKKHLQTHNKSFNTMSYTSTDMINNTGNNSRKETNTILSILGYSPLENLPIEIEIDLQASDF